MARLTMAALLLLSARALADESCAADGTCQTDEDETAALLQRSAMHKAQVSEHSHAKTTETKTLTCYPDYAAATCGSSMKCFQDTTGCTSSGGGVCCKAAGNGAGLEQCKFCGDDTCGPCPDAPTPAPTTPSGNQVGETCGNSGSTGMYYGECMDGLVCVPPADPMPGASNTCAKLCGSFDGTVEDVTGGCNKMQSCSCKAELPCSPWAEGAQGCYMYCC